MSLHLITPLFFFTIFEVYASEYFNSELSLTNVNHPEIIIETHRTQIDFRAERAYSIGNSSSPIESNQISLPGIVRLSELTKSYQLNFTKRFNNNTQTGFSLPIVTRTDRGLNLSNEKTSIGDLKFFGAYEAMEDFSSKPYSPQIIIFSSLKVPTGTTLFEIGESPLSDAIGIGSYEFTGGGFLIKRINVVDVFVTGNLAFGFERNFSGNFLTSINKNESISISGYHGGEFSMGTGIRTPFFPFRVGLSFVLNYASDRLINNTQEILHLPSTTRSSISIDAQLQWNNTTLVMAKYSDESILGTKNDPKLLKKFELSISTRWNN